jgi:hypothetical protein
MREVHCPHCNATNRRPKCGSCRAEIADPPAIEFAWALYDRRTVVGIALGATALFLISWPTFCYIYPATSADCEEQAARSARSNDAMRVLLRLCYEKFPSQAAAKAGVR